MKVGIEVGGLAGLERGLEDDTAEGVTAAMREAGDLVKQDWRDQIEQAGLGRRLALTVRSRVYPANAASIDAAAYIWTKAPKIIDSYARGPTIVPTDGRRALAIPTKNVPMKGRGRTMTPVEVESSFNQDLIIRPGKNGHLLAFVNVIQAKNRKGWRRATDKRLAQGRAVKLVLMFIFVRQVHVRKRLDLDTLARIGADRVPALLTKHWR